MKNNNEITVSVLMLTYNQEQYIDQAIRSVMLQQTDFRFELVIGNDASTDTTSILCQQWKDRYPEQIIFINRTQNLGLQQNFIQTYAHCRGKYLAICEGDDFWTSRHKLQRQVDFLETHPDYAICFHRVINYYEERGVKSLSNGRQQINTDILDLAQSNYITNVSVLFRRNCLGDLPTWFNKVSTYDYAMHLITAQHGKIHYIRRPMAVYRQHGKGIWSESQTDKKLEIALTIRELSLDYFKTRNTAVYQAIRQAHTRICLNLIRYYQQALTQKPANKAKLTEYLQAAEQRLLQYRSEWTLEDIKTYTKPVPLTLKEQLKHRFRALLSKGRASISRLIPLPSIK